MSKCLKFGTNFHWKLRGFRQGLLSLYLPGAACAQWKTGGGEFSSYVKGDLNVFSVALSPDDYCIIVIIPTNSHQPNPTNLRLCVGLRNYVDVCADKKIPHFTVY